MREILFRGKRKDNGEWVYGDLFNNYNYKKFIGELIINDYKGAACDRYEIGTSIEECITSTVGQYTGLTDKNGTRIFEGDIISIPFEEDRFPYEENIVYYEKAEVYFDTEHYGWYVRYFDDDSLSLCEYDDCDITVIGNIHDNPELLKVGDENDT